MIEQDELKSELLKKAQDQHIETQRKIREEMVRERNREIEAIIEKLGDETHSTQKTLMAQYESKVSKMQQKHEQEAAEYQTRLQQVKDKLIGEQETKNMLDENLRVLTRRMNDLEIELADKTDKMRTMERNNSQTKTELDCIYEEQTQVRVNMEKEMRMRIDEKDKEVRRVREEAQTLRNKHEGEIEMIKAQNKSDMENIQERVSTAMNKKKEVIEQLTEELRLRDLQVVKLREVMEKQRNELLD